MKTDAADETARQRWMHRVCFGVVPFCVVVVIALRAFSDPVPADKLKRLRKGMSQDEVRAILGNPTKVYPGQWTYKRMLVFGFVNLHWLPDGSFDGHVNYERF